MSIYNSLDTFNESSSKKGRKHNAYVFSEIKFPEVELKCVDRRILKLIFTDVVDQKQIRYDAEIACQKLEIEAELIIDREPSDFQAKHGSEQLTQLRHV
jgi:hypothetical protein